MTVHLRGPRERVTYVSTGYVPSADQFLFINWSTQQRFLMSQTNQVPRVVLHISPPKLRFPGIVM
jgi:hypothetical protein